MENSPIKVEKILNEEGVEIMSVKWSPDDSMLALGCSDGSVKIYADGGFLRSLHCQRSSEIFPITAVKWKPATGKTRNVLMVTTSEGSYFQFHASSGRIMHSDNIQENQIFACDYKPDSSAFALGFKDNTVQIYDENSKHLTNTLGPSHGYLPGHNSRVLAIKWVDANLLLSAGWDNQVILWDLRTSLPAREILGPHITGDALDVKDDLVLTGSYSSHNQVQLWNLGDGRNIYSGSLEAQGKQCFLYTAQFSKVNKSFAVGGSGSDEGYFFNYDPVTPLAVMKNLTKPVFSIDFSNNSARAAVGCGDGSVIICSVNQGDGLRYLK